MALTSCVVMATYQGAYLVKQQLESILEQTISPNFVVVRDDNSTDETLEVLRDIQVRAPLPITIIRGDRNLGYRNSFIEALRHADADVLFFSDQDDVWYSKKIETHLGVYRNDPHALVVISDQDIVGPDLQPSGRTSLNELLNRRRADTEYVHGCCTSFHRSLRELACNPAEGFAHDDWVHAVAGACGGRRIVDTPLQAYRRHAGTATSSDMNSFSAIDVQGRSLLTATRVAANLRRRQAGARAIAGALRQDRSLSMHARQLGIETSEADLRLYAERAIRLERGGVWGALNTMIATVKGELSIRQGLADILRIGKEVLKKLRR